MTHRDSMLPISRRVVKPADCVIAFGVPTTMSQFEQVKAQSRFVRDCCPTASQFRTEIAEPFAEIASRLLALGVNLHPELNQKQLAELFKHDVVILFAHTADTSIELMDTAVATDDIVRSVPLAFDGVFDLTACQVKDDLELVIRLYNERPHCLIKFVPHTQSATFWLYFYDVLFTILAERNVSYLDAVAEAQDQLEH